MLDDKESAPQGKHSLDLRTTSRYIRKATQSSELHTQIQCHPLNSSLVIPKHWHILMKNTKSTQEKDCSHLYVPSIQIQYPPTIKEVRLLNLQDFCTKRIEPLQ